MVDEIHVGFKFSHVNLELESFRLCNSGFKEVIAAVLNSGANIITKVNGPI